MEPNNHNSHELIKAGENNTVVLTYLKTCQYQIRKEHDKIIAEIFDKELSERNKEKEQLKKRLIAAYQRQAKNQKLQKELRAMEAIQFEDLKNEQKN